MESMPDKPDQDRKYAKPPSMHPLTPEQALAAALKIKPEDLKKAEQDEKKAKEKKGKK